MKCWGVVEVGVVVGLWRFGCVWRGRVVGGKGVFGTGEEGGRELFFYYMWAPHKYIYVATSGKNLTTWRPHKHSNGQTSLTVHPG